MKNKIIGIDIDGVITDEGPADNNIWHNSLCKYLGKKIKRVNNAYNFVDAYNLPNQIINDFLAKELEKIYREVKPAPGVSEALKGLIKMGFEIFIITARDSNFHSLTANWLKKYEIPYTLLIHEDNKAPLAAEKKIELFIEDNEQNARQLLNYNIPVIIVNRYHNQGISNNKMIVRVNNWSEIKKHIYTYFQLNESKNVS